MLEAHPGSPPFFVPTMLVIPREYWLPELAMPAQPHGKLDLETPNETGGKSDGAQ